jgi:hypothetical protein
MIVKGSIALVTTSSQGPGQSEQDWARRDRGEKEREQQENSRDHRGQNRRGGAVEKTKRHHEGQRCSGEDADRK